MVKSTCIVASACFDFAIGSTLNKRCLCISHSARHWFFFLFAQVNECVCVCVLNSDAKTTKKPTTKP